MYVRLSQDTELFGDVDQVPGLFHVATRFHHVAHVPVFPIESYLVFDCANIRPIPLGIQRRSIAYAWLRLATTLAGVTLLGLGVATLARGLLLESPAAIIGLVLAIVASVAIARVPQLRLAGLPLLALSCGILFENIFLTTAGVDGPVPAWFALAGLALIAVRVASDRWTRAGRDRALELAVAAHLPLAAIAAALDRRGYAAELPAARLVRNTVKCKTSSDTLTAAITRP